MFENSAFSQRLFINDSCDPQHIRATLCLAMASSHSDATFPKRCELELQMAFLGMTEQVTAAVTALKLHLL